MALIQCDFFSNVLGLSTSMYVILPQETANQIGMKGVATGKKHKTLLLLHGLSDDHTIWLRRTSIERYVAPLGLAVVMPAVQRSFYTDMAKGLKYEEFISRELPEIARSFFPLSDRREDNYVAGLSMGGYGAFKLALGHPEYFVAAASLSGTLDITFRAEKIEPDFLEELQNIFGKLDKLPGSTNDLFYLAGILAESENQRPRLYQCCGTEDFLYESNLRFKEHAEKIGLELTFEEDTGEEHTWSYWDKKILRVLEWLRIEM